MKTYATFKSQIEGFQDVLETVKAVEKIAASSVHNLKIKVESLNAYSRSIQNILARILLFYTPDQQFLLLQSKVRPHTSQTSEALIIITGDKGLVGGLWQNIINLFLKEHNNYTSIIVLGSKGAHYLEEEHVATLKIFAQASDIPQEQDIHAVTDYAFAAFAKGTFSKVDILYAQSLSLAEQKPIIAPFLPFAFQQMSAGIPASVSQAFGLPIFDSGKKIFFDELMKKYIDISFHKVVLEAKLSELSSRTVSMEHASMKTKEYIKSTTLLFRKENRRVVTQRQIESFTAHNTQLS